MQWESQLDGGSPVTPILLLHLLEDPSKPWITHLNGQSKYLHAAIYLWISTSYPDGHVGWRNITQMVLVSSYKEDIGAYIANVHWNGRLVKSSSKFSTFLPLTKLFVELLAHVYRNYNIGVIVDLHAAPGSQNHWEHSATRDGSLEWGTTDTSITQTVQIIDFLASRSLNRIHHHP